MCCSVYADVIYIEDGSIYRLTADTSGSLQSVRLNGDFDGTPKIVNINGRELLLVFGHEGGGSLETSQTLSISVYDTSNFSTPIVSKRFQFSELPYISPLKNVEVWGNNILLPCLNNTIVEFDPLSCSIVGRYTFEDDLSDSFRQSYSHLLKNIPAPFVTVFNGKIYAAFASYNYAKIGSEVNSASVIAADGDPEPFKYFVEMSSLGVISRELPELYASVRECSDPRAIDGKLYVKYVEPVRNENGRVISHNRGIYVFSSEVSISSAQKIVFPKGVTVDESSSLCSDGRGGIYFAAYKYYDSYEDDSVIIVWIDPASVEESGIYHYDGSSVSKVYTGNVLNVVYDETLNMLFTAVAYTTKLTIEGVTEDVESSKLVMLRPDSYGNFSVVREINESYWCEVMQGTTSPVPAPSPTSGDNPPSSNPPTTNPTNPPSSNPPSVNPTPTSNDSRPDYNTNPPYYYDDPYYDDDPYYYDDPYYDDPYYDGRDSRSPGGSGGCNSGFGLAVLALLFMRRRRA